MRIQTRKTIATVALAALLGLGACSNAATQEQAKSDSQTEAQSQVQSQAQSSSQAEDQTKTSLSAAAEAQSIKLEGVGNARQLGGYVGAGGKTVKDGVLLRTAALSGATEEDIKRLTDTYHLGEMLDFRMGQEVEADPELQIDGVKNLNIRIIDEEALAKARESLSAEDQEMMASDDPVEKLKPIKKLGIVGDQMYVNFLSNDAGKQGYAQMFKELLELPEGKSLLFHCTQGKDRTGCAAMLILSALGVDVDTIMSDYMLTNDFNAELIAQERQELLDAGIKEDQIDEIMIARDQVFSQTMTNGMDWLKKEYGSVKEYIIKELGVTEEQIAQLQEKFLV